MVSRAFGDAAVDEAVLFIVDTAVRDATSLAAAGAALEPDVDAGPLDAITPVRPFLRWDPVKPPVVVARHGFTPGESLRQLVVRSEVDQDPETLEVHVGSVAAYAADHASLGYRPQSERHLAPPKTSQSEAELHGAFDRAIGSTRHADHVRMLGIALREAGTLFDVEVRG